jgi:hypothetical protein
VGVRDVDAVDRKKFHQRSTISVACVSEESGGSSIVRWGRIARAV